MKHTYLFTNSRTIFRLNWLTMVSHHHHRYCKLTNRFRYIEWLNLPFHPVYFRDIILFTGNKITYLSICKWGSYVSSFNPLNGDFCVVFCFFYIYVYIFYSGVPFNLFDRDHERSSSSTEAQCTPIWDVISRTIYGFNWQLMQMLAADTGGKAIYPSSGTLEFRWK